LEKKSFPWEHPDFANVSVGAKHSGRKSFVLTNNLSTVMLRPYKIGMLPFPSSFFLLPSSFSFFLFLLPFPSSFFLLPSSFFLLPSSLIIMISATQEIPTQAQDVKVKILLTGGHQCAVNLKTDSPLLHTLLKVLIERNQQKAGFSTLFQIPIDDGKSSLCFPSDQLIGLVTEPPIKLQKPIETTPIIEVPSPPPSPVSTVTDLTSRYAQIENFLTAEENQQLLQYVLDKESEFVPTSTSTNADDYRRSMVLHSFPQFSELILNRVKAILPDVLRKLNIPSFLIGDIEAQLTMHNNANFYKMHNDNGSPDTSSRFFTYVYYFHRIPKGFTGGELRLYDSKVENNYYVAADTFRTVEPHNNSIVFFLSRYMHEVLEVSCPSKAFADSRFTINGWLRQLN
jgi:SM-20-related protein